jgi:hypothetical protein
MQSMSEPFDCGCMGASFIRASTAAVTEPMADVVLEYVIRSASLPVLGLGTRSMSQAAVTAISTRKRRRQKTAYPTPGLDTIGAVLGTRVPLILC